MMEGETTVAAAVRDAGNENIFVARQPIFDLDRRVFGYEVLFRDSEENTANITDGEQATSIVLLNTFVEFGLDRLVGDKHLFINMPESLLVKGRDLLFSNPKMVIEILEDTQPDRTVCNALEFYTSKGYSIALDDFVPGCRTEELLPYADIVKVDLRALDEQQLRDCTIALKQHPVRLLAEKVETHEEFELCRELGFHYFQGYFFARPDLIKDKRLRDNKANVLRLMKTLFNTNVTTAKIEAIIKTDASLSYKLLRCVNSAYFGLSISIKSVSHAIVYLGIQTVRNWANLLMLAQLDDKPDELLRAALTRARMCELLADHILDETGHGDAAFTVGLFSLLDALLDMEMKEIVAKVPVSKEICLALTSRGGEMGKLLDIVCAYDRADLLCLFNSGVAISTLTPAYLEASEWADGIMTLGN